MVTHSSILAWEIPWAENDLMTKQQQCSKSIVGFWPQPCVFAKLMLFAPVSWAHDSCMGPFDSKKHEMCSQFSSVQWLSHVRLLATLWIAAGQVSRIVGRRFTIWATRKSTIVSVQFSSVPQSCTTLCDPMNRSTSGLPVHHHLPEFTQTRPSSPWCHPASHPLSSPSPPALNPSQHQSLFQWVNSSHEVAKVLEFQL